ncbi:hypothetical protein [Flexibacterium corallicola]|uniref:hypothetical protein n=1 Tax=Flexibacterium corallicola TaxID=3037259 RepID=UPI00286ED983|nr:hypothetical protein [Pseudovibrio sp. M1P-2-3]
MADFVLGCLIFPFRFVPVVVSLVYVVFLAVNALLVLFIPVLWDLYVVETPRFMGMFREFLFYEKTAFLGIPLVFCAVAFLNLLFANNLLNIVFCRSHRGFYYLTHDTPLTMRHYRLAGWAMSYYGLCYAIDFMIFEFDMSEAMQQVELVRTYFS